MSERGYKVVIKESSRELSMKEKIRYKDLSNMVKIESALETEDLYIDYDFSIVLSVHNDKSENTDYECYVIVAKDGTAYYTGSPSFWNSFCDIMDEISDGGIDEEWSLKVYRKPSKNREGKYFITCTIE